MFEHLTCFSKQFFQGVFTLRRFAQYSVPWKDPVVITSLLLDAIEDPVL